MNKVTDSAPWLEQLEVSSWQRRVGDEQWRIIGIFLACLQEYTLWNKDYIHTRIPECSSYMTGQG